MGQSVLVSWRAGYRGGRRRRRDGGSGLFVPASSVLVVLLLVTVSVAFSFVQHGAAFTANTRSTTSSIRLRHHQRGRPAAAVSCLFASVSPNQPNDEFNPPIDIQLPSPEEEEKTTPMGTNTRLETGAATRAAAEANQKVPPPVVDVELMPDPLLASSSSSSVFNNNNQLHTYNNVP